MKKAKTNNFKEYLYIKLQDKNFAAFYLTDVLENEDIPTFMIALDDVLKARKSNFSKIAKKMGMTRQGLYKALSEKGNPRFGTFSKIMKVIGFQVGFAPVEQNAKSQEKLCVGL